MTISRRNTVGLRLLLGLALLIVTWLSLTPHPPVLPDVAYGDKWAHLTTYLALALLADLSWSRSGFELPKWGLLLAYGVLIELAQSQIPNRFFSVADIAANAGGIALYALVVRVMLLRFSIL